MITRQATARWEGNLQDGEGRLETESGAVRGPYSFRSRFEQGEGTNPEELIAAAHAGCFSMALSHQLSQDGFEPERVETTARVHLKKSEGGFAIPRIELNTKAQVPGISAEKFQQAAETAKTNCPVSKALAGVEIVLNASLQ